MSQEFKSTTSSKKNPFKKKKSFGTNQFQSNTKVSVVKSNKDEEGSEYQKQIQNITIDNINLMESLVKSKAQDESQIEKEDEQENIQQEIQQQNLEVSQNDEEKEQQNDVSQSQNYNGPQNSELLDTVDLEKTIETNNPKKSVNNNNYSYDAPQWSDIRKPSMVKDRKGSMIYQQDQLLILVLKKLVKEDQKMIEQLKKENASLKEEKNSVQKDVDQLRRQINEIDLERKQLQKDKMQFATIDPSVIEKQLQNLEQNKTEDFVQSIQDQQFVINEYNRMNLEQKKKMKEDMTKMREKILKWKLDKQNYANILIFLFVFLISIFSTFSNSTIYSFIKNFIFLQSFNFIIIFQHYFYIKPQFFY